MPNNGLMHAQRLIEKYAITQPNEIPIEDIITNEGPYIIEKPIAGAEGRIVCYDDLAIITVNSSIKDNSKRRFVLAHELGHYVMHRKLQPFYKDTENDLWEWKSNKQYENEANEFAAELLMPTEIFLKSSKRKKFSLEFVQELKELFDTSLTATAIRFAEKGNIPILLVCSQNNIVKWYAKNVDFPFSKIFVHEEVPVNTVAFEYFIKNIKYNEPEEIDPKNWQISDRYFGELKYYEQCIYFEYFGYVLSFIWIDK